MEHTIIKNAFEKSKILQQTDNCIIYMSFVRLNIFYKNTYYILYGNKEYVETSIKELYKETEQDRIEDYRADNIQLLDTPFDTFCSGICNTGICNMKKYNICNTNDKNKCSSHWISMEYKTKKELDDFIQNIPYIKSYYNNYEVLYITKNGLRSEDTI
jgi:hypothetical protein